MRKNIISILKITLIIICAFFLVNTLFGKIDVSADTNSNDISSQSTNMLDVTFSVVNESSIDLATTESYSYWNYDNNGSLLISVSNLVSTKKYDLVISMQGILYSPVETLPVPYGAEVSFQKNEPIQVNGTKTYDLEPFSGTVTYSFNRGVNSIESFENFSLDLKYDYALWDKQKGFELNYLGSEYLIKIELIEVGNTNTILESKKITSIKTDALSMSFRHVINYGNRSYNRPTAPGEYLAGADADVYYTVGLSTQFDNSSQYYRNIRIEIDVPSYTYNGITYYMTYDVGRIFIRSASSTYISSSYYTITENNDKSKLIIEMDDFYTEYKSFFGMYFNFPQNDVLKSLDGILKFTGRCRTYINGSNTPFYDNANYISLNNKPASDLRVSVSGDAVVATNNDYVSPLTAIRLSNKGATSNRVRIFVDFDTDNPNLDTDSNYLTDENYLKVTTMRLLPDTITEYFDVTYSMIDENGDFVWFDSETGNVVSEGTEGATRFWTHKLKNKYYNISYDFIPISHSNLFNRGMLREDHRNYYFSSVDYIVGRINASSSYWQTSALFSFDSSPGTFWGKINLTTSDRVYVTSHIYEDDGNGEFILKSSGGQRVKGAVVDSSPYGIGEYSIDKTLISAGESFSVSGSMKAVSYPYTTLGVINTVDTNLILGYVLPKGVTINSSNCTFTSGSNQILSIKQITYEEISETHNLWKIELVGGHEIGYLTENLTKLDNGRTVNFTVAFNTSLTTAGTTISIADATYMAANTLSNSSAGSFDDWKRVDTYDLNNNGRTDDYIGAVDSQYSSLYIQILSSDSTIDIDDSISMEGSDSSNDEIVSSVNDEVGYELFINCSAGGTATDFEYYIPIVKKDSIIDNEIIFSNQFSMQLLNEVAISNNMIDKGVKVLYTFDSNLTYQLLVNNNEITWYESIPSGKTYADVTFIKVVAENITLENGLISNIQVNVGYLFEQSSSDVSLLAGDLSSEELKLQEFIKSSGMNIQWTSRGFYRYRIGSRSVEGHYSTAVNNLEINYEFDQYEVSLTASKGDNHSDNIGNDSFTIDDLTPFYLDQEFTVKSVTTYNVALTTVGAMETNATTLTGDAANRTFAFYIKLDSNSKVDIASSSLAVGTVSANQEFSISLEIFNADNITDITTIRHVDFLLVSNNGVTLPIRINIQRELTQIDSVSNSIVEGRQYLLFSTINQTVEVSADSEFTIQFISNNLVPYNYTSTKLLFDSKLPNGTTIVLIDWTNNTDIKYYFYEVSNITTSEIELTNFNVLGSTTEYYQNSVSTSSISEKLLFIFDLPDTSTTKFTNKVKLSRTLNVEGTDTYSDPLTFVASENREFTLSATVNQELKNTTDVTYTVSELDYEDSKYNDKKLSLIITPSSNCYYQDAKILYNNSYYYLNSDNKIIIPLTDAQLDGTYTVQLQFISDIIDKNNGSYDLNIELWASNTSNGNTPYFGEKLQNDNISISNYVRTPSIKISSISRTVFMYDDINLSSKLVYEAVNVTGKVTIEFQKKLGEGYVTDSTIVDDINNGLTAENGVYIITNTRQVVFKLSEFLTTGSYQILITTYDYEGNKTLTVTQKLYVKTK